MDWIEINAVVRAEAVESVAEAMYRHAPGGVAIEESPDSNGLLVVKAYLPANRSLGARRRHIREALGHLSLLSPFQWQERRLKQEDWGQSWKAHFQPHPIGQRLVVRPTWQDYSPSPGQVVLTLDPGLAFGTGLHPSTQLCLVALETLIRPGMEVLDLGTGSGIQAIAAARLGAARVLALDIDPVAVEAARNHVSINSVAGIVMVAPGSLPLSGNFARWRFDLVVANIVARIISDLAQGLMAVLKPGAHLIAGGIIAEHSASVAARLRQAGAAAIEETAEGDWRTLVAQAPPGS